MKSRLSPCRRGRLNAAKFARSTIVGLALLGATSVELGAIGVDSELRAQSIINSARPSGNNALKSFSAPAAAFDARSIVEVKLPAPETSSSVVDASQYKFTFYFPQNANANEITAIDLLCSPDKGKTWHACASALPSDKNKEFLFQAPEPGEYWFALMTSFKSHERSFSSTKGMVFTQGAGAADDSFALADDGESAPDLDPDSLAELSDLSAPPVLPQSGEELLIDNASYAGEDVQPELATPTAPQIDAPELQDMQAPPEETTPRPGKLRNLSFGVGKGSGSLLVTVRWFRPEDLDAKYAIDVKSLSVERAPAPTGPWTIIAEDLDVNQAGYSWTATPEEMKPFYVRTVARDAQGNVWRDVTNAPMDVNQPAVRSALGPVKTPAPFTDPAKTDESAAKTDAPKEKTAMIRNAASGNDEPTDSNAKSDSDDADDLKSEKRDVRLVSTVERSQSKASSVPRERPYIPAPTDPNEFQLNPLFTKGFSVLYQSSQARTEPSSGKRSIFTPPSRAPRNAYVRPAERRYSPREIAAARIEQERKAYQERLQYNKEHEMESFEQNPQLMEGRMFYMDSNGELTTTPPPEMQQALGYGTNMEALGWTRVDQANGLQGNAMTTAAATPDGEPIFMPTNAETYDASARSGAAIWSNDQYPQASNPGSSPLNDRYSNGANAAPQGMGGTGAQTIPPQSSYSPSNYGTAPRYVSNASSTAATSNYAFPPQPLVSH